MLLIKIFRPQFRDKRSFENLVGDVKKYLERITFQKSYPSKK